MALSLAGAACLSFVGCGNDGSKIEAANRKAFGKVYAAISNYSANLAALGKNSTESKNFEFKIGFDFDMKTLDMSTDELTSTQLKSIMSMNFNAAFGAKTGAENQMYAYINAKNLDNQLANLMHAYFTTKQDDDVFVRCYMNTQPEDWETTFTSYYTETTSYELNTSANFGEAQIYKKVEGEEDQYQPIFVQPEDWDTNYQTYYVLKPQYVQNTNQTFDAATEYYKLSDMVYAYLNTNVSEFVSYELLATEPADWNLNYKKYYKLGYNYQSNTNPDFEAGIYYTFSTTDDDYHLLEEKPADWETNYESYYVQVPAYVSNTNTTFEANNTYALKTSLPEAIADVLIANIEDGKYSISLPIETVKDMLPTTGDEDATTDIVDTQQISSIISSIKNIQNYDQFKALIAEMDASISSSTDANGSALIISQSITEGTGLASTTTSNELKIYVGNNGSMTISFKSTVSTAGIQVSSMSLNLSISLSTFDESQVPTEVELEDYEVITLEDIF